MAYISFSNTPVKKVEEEKPKYVCGNCIHKIFIPGGLYRCSITNKYMYHNQISEIPCVTKDEDKVTPRKVIAGLFTFDNDGNIKWTGLLTFCSINDVDDTQAFKELFDKGAKEIFAQYPQLKDMVLVHCIVAESKYNRPFVSKTNLLPETIIQGIIADANSKLL